MIVVKAKQDKINLLRKQREKECFPIINRGRLWYNSLTTLQMQQLKQWYNDWLMVTETLVIPKKPAWIDEKVNLEEQAW